MDMITKKVPFKTDSGILENIKTSEKGDDAELCIELEPRSIDSKLKTDLQF